MDLNGYTAVNDWTMREINSMLARGKKSRVKGLELQIYLGLKWCTVARKPDQDGTNENE
ncbi:hypothetical protein [Paenibacillus oleatilyticus]|uniref:Uncharacterized protein n=1 Tax=Paenibacillus oleatilyticus TaxID=2594886 RepID=A0ABV4V743_9BACL